MTEFPIRRMRRLRYHPQLREMLAGVRLSVDELIPPLFVREGKNICQEITSMPGQYQYSVDQAMETVRRWWGKGLRSVLLFGIPESKDPTGSGAWDDNAAVQRLSRTIKETMGDMLVITDTCLCEYTDHGHCGPIVNRPDGQPDVDNDAALELLGKVATSQARSGADIVAPSGMMDGQVSAIREKLDEAGFQTTAIMSYAVKYASGFYGPFRDAAESPPSFGDRRTYQMDFRTTNQAMMEAASDLAEGADIIMVKPAGAYLDVIAHIRREFEIPLAAYHVSGEYSMIKAAAQKGWLDERSVVMEVATAIKRAGADIIITYFAEQLADWLGE